MVDKVSKTKLPVILASSFFPGTYLHNQVCAGVVQNQSMLKPDPVNHTFAGVSFCITFFFFFK